MAPVVALGQQVIAGVTMPLAELSTDGGATWSQVPFGASGPDPAITALTAGPGGFTVAVHAGPQRQQRVTIWTSAHGTSWTQTPARATSQLAALAPVGSGPARSAPRPPRRAGSPSS